MLQIDHRDSHDIDLFITDAQYLPYLNPEIQGYDLAVTPDGYDTDGTSALKIVYDGLGEIDFICCGSVTPNSTHTVSLCGRIVSRETTAEILGKKIVFRGASLQPRDMFDIAAACRALGEDTVVASLRDIAPYAGAALTVARKMHPDLARTVMRSLMIRPGFHELPGTAQETTCRVLDRLAAEA